MNKHSGMLMTQYQRSVLKFFFLSAVFFLPLGIRCLAQPRNSADSTGQAGSYRSQQSAIKAGSAGLAQKATQAAAQVQQHYGLDPKTPLLSRVRSAPDDVIRQFKEAGMSPTEHQLTKAEMQTVSSAIKALPPLHQSVMQQHLHSISFLDNMPNTALTSTITEGEGFKLFHITFRAGILHQTISEWVNEKERSCFTGSDSTVVVSIQAGLLNALTYIMIHEGTHVVDASLGLLSIDSAKGYYAQTSFKEKFVEHTWQAHTKIDWSFSDTLVNRNRYRVGGRQFQPAEAPRVYKALGKSPFVSLYGTASWNEDLAELLTVYHLTSVLKQPFRIVVSRNGKEVVNSEPLKSPAMKSRIMLMKFFY